MKPTKKKSAKIVVLNPAYKGKVSTAVVVASLRDQAAPLLKKLEKIEKIQSNEDFEKAATYVKALKELKEMAKQEADKFIDPAKQIINQTKEHFAPFNNMVDDAEASTKLIMSVWVEGQRKKELQVKQSFESGEIKKVSTVTKKIEAAQVQNGSAQVRKKMVMKIVDVKKIPREFLVPDEAAIRAVLKDGGKVSGCEWVEDFSLAI